MTDETLTNRTNIQIGAPSIGPTTLHRNPTIPDYELIREIGRGGMGVVFEARHTKLQRTVALKLMRGDSPLNKARFLAEGQVIAAVKHPNVVEVYDFGESDEGSTNNDRSPYIAMEFLTGGTLSDKLKSGSIPTPREAADLAADIASGVGAAHDLGIVHRDLKPGNVMLDGHGVPKVTDFGLAKRTTSELTRTQEAAGTPAYMAPEQAKAMKFVGPPADVWSLGVMLYEMLTGRRPFNGDSEMELLVSIQQDNPPSLRTLSKGIPNDLETICLKCLEKEPERRYQNASELATDLRNWLDDRPISARRATLLERAILWARRKPTVVAAWILGLTALMLGAFAVVVVQLWRTAEYERGVSRFERDLAQKSEAAAIQEQIRAKAAEEAAILDRNRAKTAEEAAILDRNRAKIAEEAAILDRNRAQKAEQLAATNLQIAEEQRDRANKAVELALQAERKLEESNAMLRKSLTSTEEEKKVGLLYMKLLPKVDEKTADEILDSYRKPIPQQLEPMFRKAAAQSLANAAIQIPTTLARPENIFDRSWNPYPKKEKAFAWLLKADELDGTAHPEWASHLFLLADSLNNREVAKTAGSRVVMDDRKLPDAGLPFALAFLLKRAADSSLDDGVRVAAHAAATRLAYRLMELTFEPKEDVSTRETKLLPLITKLATDGLALRGGSDLDRLSLRLAIVKADILNGTPNEAWLSRNSKELEAIVYAMPTNHPDRAEAFAFKSFATFMRFGLRYGDLAKARAKNETERIRAWDAMTADADESLRLDPASPFAHRVLGYAAACEFGIYPAYPPPDARVVTNAFAANPERAQKGIDHLEKAAEGLHLRKNPVLWIVRATFLHRAAIDFARAGEPADRVRKLLVDARTSAQTADDQRPRKRVDEARLIGCIHEDLAILVRDNPLANFATATQAFTSDRPPADAFERELRLEGKVDLARMIVRGVRVGLLPATHLVDADRALAEFQTEAEAVPANERTLSLQIHAARAHYWQALRLVVERNRDQAEKAFARAVAALEPLNDELLIPAVAHRLDNLLEGAKGEMTGRTQTEMIAALERLAPGPSSSSYLPLYFKAKQAIQTDDATTATPLLASAVEKIESGWKRRTLRIDDPFASRCLAVDLSKSTLTADVRQRRRDLLTEFRKTYSWTLAPGDADLINQALARP